MPVLRGSHFCCSTILFSLKYNTALAIKQLLLLCWAQYLLSLFTLSNFLCSRRSSSWKHSCSYKRHRSFLFNDLYFCFACKPSFSSPAHFRYPEEYSDISLHRLSWTRRKLSTIQCSILPLPLSGDRLPYSFCLNSSNFLHMLERHGHRNLLLLV